MPAVDTTGRSRRSGVIHAVVADSDVRVECKTQAASVIQTVYSYVISAIHGVNLLG